MQITIRQTNEGFSVQFPYDLLGSFKENFKTAKWDGRNKLWNVGPRSGAKLEQWANAAKAALPTEEQLAEHDEHLMLDEEIAKLKQSADAIKKQIEDELAKSLSIDKKMAEIEELKKKVEEAKTVLAAAKADIAALNEKAETAKQEAQAVAKDGYAMLNEIIDVAKAKSLANIMSANFNKQFTGSFSNRYDKHKFNDAKDEIIAMREKLKEAGLACQAIDWIAEANINRPDRDDPAKIAEKYWFDLKRI